MPDYGAWIGVTSKDQLQGARPDPNPNIDCEICGGTFSWKGYWQGRILLGNPGNADFECDDCQERAVKWHDRLTNNQRITDWVG